MNEENAEKTDRQTRHISCIEAMDCIRTSIVALEDLRDLILGQTSIKGGDVEKKSVDPKPPSLSAFLEETPEKLRILADRIRESIDGIRKGIF